ncbi:Signal transduction histidine kinase [Catalinimonas alkaloidigena]|uniref:histidine kinase n=1 Tax=Catalinimonas alkaloidigena TaxID=1075417 RepID=A0A1G9VTZ0_9BACT|nr:sensor histidine kinase [Catalinimonas alkaloidigena]SDM75722.1 Signal transduction histidine kinase [Catalinimonas alkaloidigena]
MKFFWIAILATFGQLSVAQSLATVDSIVQLVQNEHAYPQKIDLLQRHLQQIYTTQFDATIALSRYGYALAERENDAANQGDFLRFIGLSYGKKGEIDSASVYYYKAMAELEQSGATEKLGLLYDDMARMYRKLRQPERALDFYDKALHLYEQENNQEGIARIYNESGVVFRDEGDYQTANERFQKSLQIQRQRNDSVGIGYSLEFLGYNQLLIKNYAAAENYLMQALAVREQLDDAFALMLNYTALGEFYQETGQHLASIAYFQKSNALAQQIKFLDIQQYNYEQITANYEAVHDFEQAYQSLKQFNALRDSLYTVQKLKAVEEVTTLYETEKKEAQIKSQQLLIAQEKKEKYLYTTLLAFGLFLLTTLIFFVRNRNKHKTQLLLKEQHELALTQVLDAEEKERNRIAKDLHDGIVQDLTVVKQQLQAASENRTIDQLPAIGRGVSEIATEVRNLAYQMMPLTLKEFGLEKALETLLERTSAAHQFTVDFNAIGLERRFHDKIETSVYRICQELLNNSIKHSRANTISLLLLYKNQVLSITYEDNGVGFDAETTHRGIGLNSLQSRIEMVKGNITFESAENQGTAAYIRIPV